MTTHTQPVIASAATQSSRQLAALGRTTPVALDQSLISVILPIYNRPDLLAKSAGSVLAQTWYNLELIIVDDASNDNVEAAVTALDDDRVRYVRRDHNGGPAAARNTGIAIARGEYLAFQDSDDEWLLNNLEQKYSALSEHPDAALCLGQMFRVIDDGFRVFGPAKDDEITLETIASRAVAYTQTWLVRRSVLDEVGAFDEQLWIWEDWDLLLRIAERFAIVGAPQAIALSQRREDSLTQAESVFVAAARRIANKHEPTFARLPVQRSDLAYMLAHRLFDVEGRIAARVWFQRACRANPANAKAWVYWGLCLLRMDALIPRLRGTLSKNKPL